MSLLRKFHWAVQRILKAIARDIFELEVPHHGHGISLGILKLRVNTLLLRVSWLGLIGRGSLLAVSKGGHIPVWLRLWSWCWRDWCWSKAAAEHASVVLLLIWEWWIYIEFAGYFFLPSLMKDCCIVWGCEFAWLYYFCKYWFCYCCCMLVNCYIYCCKS